jgi:superfamily I DNA and/or RNA helicase
VIVEEAAKAWPSELAIPLVRGVRWALVGDHHQLPAYRRTEVERTLDGLKDHARADLREHGESAADYKRVFNVFGSLFESPSSPSPVKELAMQFRMRRPIAEVVSRAFYSCKLDTDDEATEQPSGLRAPAILINPAVVWIDTTGMAECADKRMWFNDGEVSIIAELLTKMRPVPRPGADGFGEEPLAILTPWRAQADRLQLALGEFAEFVHTVDSFQGREADIVIVSLVRDTRRGDHAHHNLGHAAAAERVNVMLSRARRLLVLVGAYEHFAQSGVAFWDTICQTVDEVGRRIQAGELS